MSDPQYSILNEDGQLVGKMGQLAFEQVRALIYNDVNSEIVKAPWFIEKSCTHQWYEVRKLYSEEIKEYVAEKGLDLANIAVLDTGVLVQCPNCMETKHLWGTE